MPETEEVSQLVAGVRAGRPRAVGRAISWIENHEPGLPALMAALAPSTGRARVLGLTGPPGVGKSTTIAALVTILRERGQRVGVLAVDPSSPFTGGALLGDRVRMQAHALDPEVFVRSMASRGQLGGLAVATGLAVRVFDAAGCDTVLVETVGVGQSEIEVSRVVDCVLVLLAPGGGDGIQAAKAGILEIGDVFVVNKADREGAQSVVRELRTMIALGRTDPDAWTPALVSIVATSRTGLPELVDVVDRFAGHTQASGAWASRRLAQARHEIASLVLARMRRAFDLDPERELDRLASAVRDGELDVLAAAGRLTRRGDKP